MASDLTGYFGNKILRWLTNVADMPSRPANLYVALFNGNPKTTGVEVGASVKAAGPRQACTFAALSAGTDHLITSNAAVDWGLSENGGVNVSHLALCDNATPGSGNIYASRPVNGGPITIALNSSVKFNSGAVTFNIGADS